MPELCQLPQLLYIADVPVEASYHGSMLLYRLLQEYPSERLFIIEHGHASLPHRRLPDVKYDFIPHTLSHRQTTRFELIIAGTKEPGEAMHLLTRNGSKRFDGILTVTHGTGWITAYRLANRLRLPLYIICHDDNMRGISRWPILSQYGELTFSRMYTSAKSRFCVSPGMEQEYYRRYGKRGVILYPHRSKDAPAATKPPERLRSTIRQITAAFAGSVFNTDSERALITLAQVLHRLGGKLVVYGSFPSSFLTADKIGNAAVEVRPPISSYDLIHELRETADFLFVPLSFLPSESVAVRTSFPSKLTDYTCAGLPMLFYAPAESSLMDWATEEVGAAICVTSNSPTALESAIAQLRSDPNQRWQLAERAIEAGAKYFRYEIARETFFKELNNP